MIHMTVQGDYTNAFWNNNGLLHQEKYSTFVPHYVITPGYCNTVLTPLLLFILLLLVMPSVITVCLGNKHACNCVIKGGDHPVMVEQRYPFPGAQDSRHNVLYFKHTPS